MSFVEQSKDKIVWKYKVPIKNDSAFSRKMWFTIIVTMFLLISSEVGVGLSIGFSWRLFIELLKGFFLIGACVLFVILCGFFIIKLVTGVFWAGRTTYFYTADDEKIYSLGSAEVKGGKHLYYRNVKKLSRCKEEGWIQAQGTIICMDLHVEEADFERVWEYLLDHCKEAEIQGE